MYKLVIEKSVGDGFKTLFSEFNTHKNKKGSSLPDIPDKKVVFGLEKKTTQDATLVIIPENSDELVLVVNRIADTATDPNVRAASLINHTTWRLLTDILSVVAGPEKDEADRNERIRLIATFIAESDESKRDDVWFTLMGAYSKIMDKLCSFASTYHEQFHAETISGIPDENNPSHS